jgi:hypothetical protein
MAARTAWDRVVWVRFPILRPRFSLAQQQSKRLKPVVTRCDSEGRNHKPQYSTKDVGLSVKQLSSTGLEHYQGAVPYDTLAE